MRRTAMVGLLFAAIASPAAAQKPGPGTLKAADLKALRAPKPGSLPSLVSWAQSAGTNIRLEKDQKRVRATLVKGADKFTRSHGLRGPVPYASATGASPQLAINALTRFLAGSQVRASSGEPLPVPTELRMLRTKERLLRDVVVVGAPSEKD